MDDQRWDQLTRRLSERVNRRKTHALLVSGLATLGLATETSAKKRKKKKKKQGQSTTTPPTTQPPTTPPPTNHGSCIGRDVCLDSPDGETLPASAICGSRAPGGGFCYCSTTLTDEPFCGEAPQGLSNDPELNLCLNGGCVAGGGKCVKTPGCIYGPIKCAPPCPFPD
jgi:hypothetical protein